jgi:hypothetical protein
MKNAGSWDVTPRGSCKNRRFGGTYHLHRQSDKNRRTLNNVSINWQLKHAAKKYLNFFAACFSCQLMLTLFLTGWFFPAWWWRRYIHPKRQFLQEPHGVTLQKTALFLMKSYFKVITVFNHIYYVCSTVLYSSDYDSYSLWGLSPCTAMETNSRSGRSFRQESSTYACFMLVSSFASSSTSKTESLCSDES